MNKDYASNSEIITLLPFVTRATWGIDVTHLPNVLAQKEFERLLPQQVRRFFHMVKSSRAFHVAHTVSVFERGDEDEDDHKIVMQIAAEKFTHAITLIFNSLHSDFVGVNRMFLGDNVHEIMIESMDTYLKRLDSIENPKPRVKR